MLSRNCETVTSERNANGIRFNRYENSIVNDYINFPHKKQHISLDKQWVEVMFFIRQMKYASFRNKQYQQYAYLLKKYVFFKFPLQRAVKPAKRKFKCGQTKIR